MSKFVGKIADRKIVDDRCKCKIIALSHIHVSAAYRSRIDENYDTLRSEAYFVQATYVPRKCDVPVAY